MEADVVFGLTEGVILSTGRAMRKFSVLGINKYRSAAVVAIFLLKYGLKKNRVESERNIEKILRLRHKQS